MKLSLTALSLVACFSVASAADLKDYNRLTPEESAAFEACRMEAIENATPLFPRKDKYTEEEKKMVLTEAFRIVFEAAEHCATKMGIDVKTIIETPKGP